MVLPRRGIYHSVARLVLLWCYYGVAMVLLWCCYGVARLVLLYLYT